MKQIWKRMWRVGITAATIVGGLQAQVSLVQVGRNGTEAWFLDGTGVEIHTESTGSTKISSRGEVGIGPGIGPEDALSRVVVDSGNNILFAYSLEASRGKSLDTVSIRVGPVSPAMEADILRRARAARPPTFSGAHLPTVAAVREFPPIKIGEAVTLDILYKPSTGEKIYDVFRPITRQAISLKDIVVKVNGKIIMAPRSSMSGDAVRVDIPDHGAYVVALYGPQKIPAIYNFQPIAHADGRVLSWEMDGEKVEIESRTNVLTQPATASLWVYHDRQYHSKDLPYSVSLRVAETVEWLLPRK